MSARTLLFAFLGTVAVALSAPAASAAPTQVEIGSGPLAEALAQLIRQTGAEILYEQRIVSGARSSPVRGTMAAEQALAQLLAGSGVGYRRTPQGVFILYSQGSVTEAEQQAPVPEILVIGRKSQNADIRRTQNDIQPYLVSTGRDIENAHRDNVGQFFRSRVSADAQFMDPAQDTFSIQGAVNSQIDLRGLGSLRTLVLVDGRRMPSLPTSQFDFGQADINAMPISAIDRIETLTGTAGGIYGPGAIGGVVNIVLRRDYRGADLHVVSGITSRGDARRFGIEGRIGFTPDGGRTDVMLFGARTTVEPLLAGQAGYARRARERRFSNDPDDYLANFFPSNAVTVFSQQGNLTIDPKYGGGSLNASFTSLPIGFSGTLADSIALLKENAGKVILDLPKDQTGTDKYVLSNPTVTSGILNIRHRFNAKLEAFVDLLYFRNNGEFKGQGEANVTITAADSPNNPFQQDVVFTFPNQSEGRTRRKLDSRRLAAGVIADLGSQWKGSAELTLGQVKTDLRFDDSTTSSDFLEALRLGTAGADGEPIVDPLGSWNKLVAATKAQMQESTGRSSQVNKFRVASLRAAGPIATLPGGPLSVTLLAEQQREHSPARTAKLIFGSFPFDIPLPVRTQTVTSGYIELRAPVLPADAALMVLRGLELQLAARHDRVKSIVPENALPGSPSNDRLISVVNSGTTFTGGARFFPRRSVMLRGSLATGELPPTIEHLAVNETIIGGPFGPQDSHRGNRALGSEGLVVVFQHGSHDLKPERATTISLGAVINPNGAGLPRLSIDFSRIDVRRGVSFMTSSLTDVLENEEDFAGRVTRLPLTDADRALGFTAGRVTEVNLGAFNGGRTLVETVDAQLDWSMPVGKLGRFRLYGNATWYPTFKSKRAADASWVSRLGFTGGILDWRGNLGLEWTKGPLMLGLNAQYFDDYRPTYVSDDPFASQNSIILKHQGSNRIPSQTFVDFSARRRFDAPGVGPLRSFEISFGIQNLFDRRPALVAERRRPGYSFYGDPRRRRFELVLSTGF